MRLLADMALFVEVAGTRHFGRAAAALGMPASTLSRRIAGLEKDLGVPLIHRSTRSFALTAAGVACYQRSRRLIAEATEMREDLSGTATAGRIRIGLPADLMQTIFLPLFAEFLAAHPAVDIELLQIEGSPNLAAAALDLAFVIAHQRSLSDSGQWARRIGGFARRLFASRTYLKRRGVPLEPVQLAAHDCLPYLAAAPEFRWELRRGRERTFVHLTSRLSASSVGVLAQAARQHLGIAMLPEFFARHPHLGGGLVPVLPDWEGVPAHLFALTPGKLVPARTRHLIDYTRAEFSARLHAAGGA